MEKGEGGGPYCFAYRKHTTRYMKCKQKRKQLAYLPCCSSNFPMRAVEDAGPENWKHHSAAGLQLHNETVINHAQGVKHSWSEQVCVNKHISTEEGAQPQNEGTFKII